MTASDITRPGAALLLLGLLASPVLGGCFETPAARNEGETTVTTAQPVSELTMALDALRELNAPNNDQAVSRTVYYLNQWLGRQEIAPEWTPDPMLGTLPSALKPALEMAALERLSFQPTDIGFLQQSQWLRDVAERARREPAPPDMQDWLKELSQSTSIQQSEQVAVAERLFDWTIRNIQLDALPPPPKAPTASVGGDAAANSPPLRGEVGPGYGHTPLYILLYGHGDAWERSRVFLLLARQVGIEGGMLAITDPQSTGSSTPWCCALMIGDSLYLFDAELGLPIPAAEGKGIATLKEVIDDPKLLRNLDVEDGPQYRIKEEDLKRIIALIDAESTALTHRMQVLQAGMPNSRRLAVSVRPSDIQKRFRQHKQIGQVSLWRVPFEAALYQIGLQGRLSQDFAAANAWNREHGMFRGQHPLLRARDLHLQGVFESEDQNQGARAMYLSSRPSEKTIDRLGTSTAMRDQLGLNESLPEDPMQRSEMLESMVMMSRRAKQHATYWLGLSYYEDGNFDVAKEWLEQRVLDAKPRSPWSAGARYNLARTHEQLGEVSEALKLYEADDSPQRHGNLLRAERLQTKSNGAKAPEEAPKSDDKSPASTDDAKSDGEDSDKASADDSGS